MQAANGTPAEGAGGGLLGTPQPAQLASTAAAQRVAAATNAHICTLRETDFAVVQVAVQAQAAAHVPAARLLPGGGGQVAEAEAPVHQAR